MDKAGVTPFMRWVKILFTRHLSSLLKVAKYPLPEGDSAFLFLSIMKPDFRWLALRLRLFFCTARLRSFEDQQQQPPLKSLPMKQLVLNTPDQLQTVGTSGFIYLALSLHPCPAPLTLSFLWSLILRLYLWIHPGFSPLREMNSCSPVRALLPSQSKTASVKPWRLFLPFLERLWSLLS